eukprot:m.148132 g.148132  ORF g.148132 m.148132 type:complete len:315 (-) comp30575_c0_seq2:47-991(-)
MKMEEAANADRWTTTVGDKYNGSLADATGLDTYNWLCRPEFLITSSVVYLVVIKVMHSMMKTRDAYSFPWLMRLYNIAQVAVCGYMTIGLGNAIIESGMIEIGAGVRVPNVFGFGIPIKREHQHYIFVHFLSKFLDYFDTIFIVLKKADRRLSFLHVYHHATIGPIWGCLLLLGYGSGTAMFGALLNSFVHVLMYSHYFVTSFGINNPFKKQITQVQITQFYLCIMHATIATVTDIDQIYPKLLASLQFLYHLSMVYLFTQFYNGYAKPTSAKPSTDTKKTDGDVANVVRTGTNGVTAAATTSPTRRRIKATTD